MKSNPVKQALISALFLLCATAFGNKNSVWYWVWHTWQGIMQCMNLCHRIRSCFYCVSPDLIQKVLAQISFSDAVFGYLDLCAVGFLDDFVHDEDAWNDGVYAVRT